MSKEVEGRLPDQRYAGDWLAIPLMAVRWIAVVFAGIVWLIAVPVMDVFRDLGRCFRIRG
jgi:hypothetical protein